MPAHFNVALAWPTTFITLTEDLNLYYFHLFNCCWHLFRWKCWEKLFIFHHHYDSGHNFFPDFLHHPAPFSSPKRWGKQHHGCSRQSVAQPVSLGFLFCPIKREISLSYMFSVQQWRKSNICSTFLFLNKTIIKFWRMLQLFGSESWPLHPTEIFQNIFAATPW